MAITIFILSIYIFIKALSYGIYEIKQNSNTIGGIVTIVFAAFSLIFLDILIYTNGFY